MLFIIQHTQSRQQTATQLKLDELIRAIPEADDLLVHIETAKEAELIEREQDHIAITIPARDLGGPRRAVTDGQGGRSGGLRDSPKSGIVLSPIATAPRSCTAHPWWVADHGCRHFIETNSRCVEQPVS